MISWLTSAPIGCLRAPAFSPKWLFVRGMFVLSLFFCMELAGFRDYTCVITGTSPTGNPGDQMALLLGMIYVLLYFGATMLAPVLLLASLFARVLFMLFPGKKIQENNP